MRYKYLRYTSLFFLIIFIGTIAILLYINYKKEEQKQIYTMTDNASRLVASRLVGGGYFKNHYNSIVYNQNCFKDAHKYTPYELIYDFKDTRYIPVINYLEEEPTNDEIINSYNKLSLFFEKTNPKFQDELYVTLNNPHYNYGDYDGQAMNFKIKKRIVSEEFLYNQFNELIEEMGLSTQNYFYEYILTQNYKIRLDISTKLQYEYKEYNQYPDSEKKEMIQYLKSNYSSFYNKEFETYVAYFILEFSKKLENIEINQNNIKEVEFIVKVYNIQRVYTATNKGDLYQWAVNTDEYFETCKQLGYPKLLV